MPQKVLDNLRIKHTWEILQDFAFINMTEQTWSRQLHPCLKSDMTMKITERWASKFPEGKTFPSQSLNSHR